MTEEENIGSEQSETQTKVVLDGPKTEDFEYPPNYKEKYIIASDLPNKLCPLYEIIGQDASKLYNFYFLNEKEILMGIATSFQIFNIETKERKISFSTEIGGIGAVTTHPSNEYFAVGECGSYPNIYIYRYKDSQASLYRILRKGTEGGFSALSFNDKGDLLASVGGDPDYNLVIWNWKAETIILKAKAFSQEVYRVSFSNNFEGKLITSGMGHIKFWVMAETFTGLKLQGELGKFGQVDLSDISSFVEFPDGKVLSGSEHGTFLLWEGIFIKANLDEGNGKKCHTGLVEHMSWELSDNPEDIKIMTAGHDGYVKWWKYLDIENVKLDDFSNGVITPLKTIQLINPKTKNPIKIMRLVKHNSFWLVQDGNGFLIKVIVGDNPENDKIQYEIISQFHSGPILKSTFIPNSSLMISQGTDKKLSITNFDSHMKSFPMEIFLDDPNEKDAIMPTCCDIPKKDTTDEPFIIIVGYDNGMFKIFSLDPNKKKLDLISEARPHQEKIMKILFSQDGSYICSCTKKELFFFIVERYDKIIPWCCIQKEEVQIVDIDWHPDSKKVLVGYTDGTLEEIVVPMTFDNTKTFILTEYSKRDFKMKLAENQIVKMDEKKKKSLKEKGKLKEEPEPGSIFSCRYLGLFQEDDFIVTTQKPFNESLYLCKFNFSEENTEKRPVFSWKMPNNTDYFIKHISKNYVFLTDNKGGIQIRHRKCLDKYIEIFPNLPGRQIISISTSLDEKFISVCFIDGINVIYALDVEGYEMNVEMFTQNISDEKQNELNNREFDEPSFEKQNIDNMISGIKQGEYNVMNEENIDKLLSLEDEKQQLHEREKERIANEKREALSSKVNKLRDDFNKLQTQNEKLPEEIRLTESELTIDDKYLEIVDREKQENLDDVNKKYNWLKARVEVTIKKIKDFFLSSVETNKIVVYSLRTNEHVSTLRCPSLPINFSEKLKKLEDEINDFHKKIDFDSLIPKYQPLLEAGKIDEEAERKKFEGLLQKNEEKKQSQREAESSKANLKQSDIEVLIEDIKSDIKEIDEMIKSREEQNRKNKLKNEENNEDMFKQCLCPDYYFLKNKNDKIFNEKNMLTSNIQKRKIYLFLKLLYDERQCFNNKIKELKDEKIEILNKLKAFKQTIEEYNRILKVEETYDWFSFTNMDTTEDLFKIPEDDLNNYILSKVNKDEELKEIYKEELKREKNKANEQNNKKKDPNNDDDDDWNFVVKERANRQVNETQLDDELQKLNNLKYNYLKEEVLKEINELINNFDKKIESLKNEKASVSFYQKLGEYELLLKHKELNKLRAFESEDKKFCDKLTKLFDEYNVNLDSLKRSHTFMEESVKDLKTKENDLKLTEEKFDKLVENERENKEQLYKIFRQKKQDGKDADDKLDQEEELNMPKSINSQTKHEMYNLRDKRLWIEDEIKKNKEKINNNKQGIENDKKNKKNLDIKKGRLIEKIQQNEVQKQKYINQIDLAMPVQLDQFKKVDINTGKTPLDLGDIIFIAQSKLNKLKNDNAELEEFNKDLLRENSNMKNEINNKEKEKDKLEKLQKKTENNFKTEQILKFGLEIDFDFLLQASKKTTIDRYENEYKKLKMESDRKIDDKKEEIKRAKEDLQRNTDLNTKKLLEIRDGLSKKQSNDKTLEEKNSEITKKNNKKYKMFNLKKKKLKLIEILKLLKQQMEALKKEIDIFRRKGGHIYSTIASNLV